MPPASSQHPVEHRCPACDVVVGTARRDRPAIGRPFAECPRCGGFVSRAPYEEWALMKPGTRLAFVASKGTFALALGLLPALALGLFAAFGGGESIERMTLVAVAVLGAVASAVVRFALLSREVRRSQSRMADPMYRAKLAEFGMRTSGAGGAG